MNAPERVNHRATPDEYMFPDEPTRFHDEDADRLFVHAARLGASDITIQTDHKVVIEVHGALFEITNRALDNLEVSSVVNLICGQNGSAQVKQGFDLDRSYELRLTRKERYRYRVNATACYSGFEDGVQITLRVITSRPPRLEDLGVEEGIVSALMPRDGLVVVTGATGSGKSTLLAGVVRRALESDEFSGKVITYEAPIEFVYDEVEQRGSLIAQHEVGRHLESFQKAVRNSLRRAPRMILVGETRDAETVNASLEVSQTGHPLYTTMHTNSVPETFYRMVNMFPQEERHSKMFEILESLRLVVTQCLVRRVDGKRVALREYLEFDADTREQLRECTDFRELTREIGRMVERKGQPMSRAAERAVEQGLITEDVARPFRRRGELFAEV